MRYQHPGDILRHEASGPERLQRLAAYLDTLPAGLLTFTRWHGHGTGCAVGLAAHNCVWMQVQGLRVEAAENLRMSHPAYGHLTDWPAVAAFFDISLDTALDLFSVRGYGGDLRPEPHEVAARIRAHLSLKAPVPA